MIIKTVRALICAAGLLLAAGGASAQSTVPGSYPTSGLNDGNVSHNLVPSVLVGYDAILNQDCFIGAIPYDSNCKLPFNASVSISGQTFSTFSGSGSYLNVQDPNWVQALIDMTSPEQPQTSHGVNIGAIEGCTPVGSPPTCYPLFTGAESSGAIVGLIQGDTTIPWPSITTATTTQLVAGVSGKKIYVTHLFLSVSAADTVTLEYSAIAGCASAVTSIGGPISFGANGGSTEGGGLGPVLVVPAGNYLCVVTNAAATLGGVLTYTQF